MIIYGYHGTTKENALSILRTRYFISSCSERDWLGKGVYFFINQHKDKAIEQSKKWALLRKYTFYAVLEAKIDAVEEKIMDLNDEEWFSYFQEFRNIIMEKVIKKGLHVFENPREFDCYVIDRLCDKIDISVVIKNVFINFSPYYGNIKIPHSYIPNCRIMCVKDKNVIDKQSIKIVKEGSKNG